MARHAKCLTHQTAGAPRRGTIARKCLPHAQTPNTKAWKSGSHVCMHTKNAAARSRARFSDSRVFGHRFGEAAPVMYRYCRTSLPYRNKMQASA